MNFLDTFQRRTAEISSRWRTASTATSQRLSDSITSGYEQAVTVTAESYNAALTWKNNSEFSNWLTDHFSNQYATVASKAMDAEYLRTHIGGGWHRLYDDGHSLAGSWKAVTESLPDL